MFKFFGSGTLLHDFDCSWFDASTTAATSACFTIVVIFVDLNVCCSLIGWYCEDFKKKRKKNCSASQVDGFLLAFVVYEEKLW